MKKIFKILLLSVFIPILSSFKTPSEEAMKEVINNLFQLEQLSRLGNDVPSVQPISNNDTLKEALDSKHKFYRLWNKKLQYKITSFDQGLIFDKIEKIGDLYKVFFRRNIWLQSSNFPGIIQKSFGEKYIALLTLKNNSFLLDCIVFQEETPIGYERLADLEGNYRSFDFSNLISDWKDKYDNIDLLFKDFQSIIDEHDDSINNTRSADRYFNIDAAINYAQKYALNYNPQYKDFSASGGDCTNFVSQCLTAGGLELTYSWRPYTNAWYNVQYLRNYLLENNIAAEYPKIPPNPAGSVIQFFNPEKNWWAHSGIITYSTKTDYLYCCHTYNKLNYPLSGVYPIFYHKIRVLEIN